MKPPPLLHVYWQGGPERLLMGRLALKDRRTFFEYDSSFLQTGFELSPLKLPLKAGVIRCEDMLFEGLFGVFNDSLPDGWGRLLLDRKLMSLGVTPGILSPLDRLRYVGSHGMGALDYVPAIENPETAVSEDLDEIAHEIATFQETEDLQFIDELLTLGGSSAGARPKIMMNRGAEKWMVKFRSAIDPMDMGPVEYAYHLMAKAAGLDVPEAHLFPARKGPGYFGVRRFDRMGDTRIHMHTVSGLLHADHRLPSLDYETLLKATLWLTKDVRECEKQLKAAVFNILAHNRDDHAKNFSFLMDAKGVWRVSPAYDLTFSSGPAGEHCTTVMGEGKTPRLSHVLALAQKGGLTNQQALQIVEEVKQSTARWKEFAEEANVSAASSTRIEKALNHCVQNLV